MICKEPHGTKRRFQLRQLMLAVTGFAVLIAVLFVVMAWIVPQFGEIYDDFGLELPTATVALIQTSRFLNSYWLITLLASFAVIVGLASILRLYCSPLTRRLFLWRVPFIGGVYRNLGMSRFSHVLAIMVGRQVPLPKAIMVAGEASRATRKSMLAVRISITTRAIAARKIGQLCSSSRR